MPTTDPRAAGSSCFRRRAWRRRDRRDSAWRVRPSPRCTLWRAASCQPWRGRRRNAWRGLRCRLVRGPALEQRVFALGAAQKLAAQAPAHERAYIEALAKRYAADPAKADKMQLAKAYSDAMGELAKRYPDDLDAATLYAESMMNLRPWDLWSAYGKPAINTREIITVLEGVIRRNPRHTGAHHYLIHAVEA